MKLSPKPRKHFGLVMVLLAIIIIYILLLSYPWQKQKLEHCICLLECQYCFGLTAPGCDTVYFSGVKDDTILTDMTCRTLSAMQTTYGSAFWYSQIPLLHLCRGQLLTTATIAAADSIIPSLQDKIEKILTVQEVLTAKREDAINHEEHFLSYYMSTHNVIDEGYNQMGEHAGNYQQMQNDIRKVRTALSRLRASGEVRVEYFATYIVHQHLGKDSAKVISDTCRRIGTKGNIVRLQTLSGKMPQGAFCLASKGITSMTFSFQDTRKHATLIAYNCPVTHETPLQQLKKHTITGKVWKEGEGYRTSIPLLKRSEGAPLLDSQGHLLGIVSRDRILPY